MHLRPTKIGKQYDLICSTWTNFWCVFTYL